MPTRQSILLHYSSVHLMAIGLLLICVGGLAYAIFNPAISPFSIIILTTGIIFFFRSFRGFRVSNIFNFILIVIIVNALVIFVDMWPLQLVFQQASVRVLAFLGVPSNSIIQPHFGGLQIQLFVQSALSGNMVGGEIDNACAGIPVLFSGFFLLVLSDEKPYPAPTRLTIGVFMVNLVIIGNFIRILAELWLPAVGLSPFDLVHYPLAFVLGMSGIIAIAIAGHQWTNAHERMTSS